MVQGRGLRRLGLAMAFRVCRLPAFAAMMDFAEAPGSETKYDRPRRSARGRAASEYGSSRCTGDEPPAI